MSERTSEQAYAYTPGLKVKRFITPVKERRLPIPGEVLVELSDKVDHDTIVAKAFLEGDAHVINGANALKVEREDVVDFIVKKPGDPIEVGEVLLHYSAFFGLLKRDVLSPIKGIVESISEASGQIILREPPRPLHLDAYIPGEIVDVMTDEGVVIRTRAAMVQGIFGIGEESHGTLKILVETPDEAITEDLITSEDNGRILVGGSEVTMGALRRAVEVGVSGIIVGGIEPDSLKEFMGEEIGVAITGHEDVGITLIITEGFGRMSISERTFNLLKDLDGNMAHINGATQIRAGVMRPEIIIPHERAHEESPTDELSAGMVAGTLVRIIRQPYFGAIGKVVSLPVELMKVQSESDVRVVEVELEDGRLVTVPRANVEIIEE